MINILNNKKTVLLLITSLLFLLVYSSTFAAEQKDQEGGVKIEQTSTITGETKTGDNRVTGTITTGGSNQSTGQRSITIPNPLGVNSITGLIANINRWLLWIAVPIFTLMIFIGAFQLMFSGGSPDKVTQGKHTITWAVIGYALLILSTGIISIIKEVLLVR
ncbi:hypothetical protein GW950_00595 [Candidatus Wolfebacteria bacterium]|nr:hypothetical protein [Candidatus Wolfebacteria bacterium]